MNLYPSFTNIRGYLSEQFLTLRTKARREAFWAKLMGKTKKLATFPDEAPERSPNRRFAGIREIPLRQIVGTLNREGDFDHEFRPLSRLLRDRWVNAYLAFQHEGWSPIIVHQVGENYYVEDGHHRVSVAQMLGLAFIQASVWEYPCLAGETKACQPEPCARQNSARVYAVVTD